jgi:hypothetical protein
MTYHVIDRSGWTITTTAIGLIGIAMYAIAWHGSHIAARATLCTPPAARVPDNTEQLESVGAKVDPDE